MVQLRRIYHSLGVRHSFVGGDILFQIMLGAVPRKLAVGQSFSHSKRRRLFQIPRASSRGYLNAESWGRLRMEPLLKISIKAGADKKGKKHRMPAAQHSLVPANLSLTGISATDSTQELFGPAAGGSRPGSQQHALEACLKVLRPSDGDLLEEGLGRGSTYHRLETFRKLAMGTTDRESDKAYEYIFSFASDDDGITNQFLEILADFLLTTSYSLRHRPARILSKDDAMCMLHRCLENEACQHNALVVVCILSHCPEIRRHSLGPVIALIERDIKEPSRRLCYKILANLAAHKYLFTRGQVEAIRSRIESAPPKDPDAARNAAAVIAHMDRISASLDAYLESLKNGKMDHAIEKEFWSQNTQRISTGARAIFPLFCGCLAHGNKELLISVCYDLVSLLGLQPALCTHALESGIPDTLLRHINSDDEDIRYAAVQLLSVITQCSLQPSGPS